jgi:hypothetical protein
VSELLDRIRRIKKGGKIMERHFGWCCVVLGLAFFTPSTVKAQEAPVTLMQSTLAEVVPSHWGTLRGVTAVNPTILILSLEDDRGDIRLVTIRQVTKSSAWRVDSTVVVIKRRP